MTTITTDTPLIEALNDARSLLGEIATRYGLAEDPAPVPAGPVIMDARSVYNLVAADMAGLRQEQLRALYLNHKNNVIEQRIIYTGTLYESPIRAAEIFRPAVLLSASGVIICHNHPTGDPTPSPQDTLTTRRLFHAGELLNIELLDHIIIGRDDYRSMKSITSAFTQEERESDLVYPTEGLGERRRECEWCGHADCDCQKLGDPWNSWRCDCTMTDAVYMATVNARDLAIRKAVMDDAETLTERELAEDIETIEGIMHRQGIAEPSTKQILREELLGKAQEPIGVWTKEYCYECGEQIIDEDCSCEHGPAEFDPFDIYYILDGQGTVVGVELQISTGGPGIMLIARRSFAPHLRGALGFETDTLWFGSRDDSDTIIDYWEQIIEGRMVMTQ